MKNPSLGMFRIACAYIGTVVGAGFASGQEILRFFSAYGWAGMWGIVITTALFFFFGYSVLVVGKNLNATSHLDIVRFTNGKVLGSVIDVIITIFLFGAFAAMLAGAGAVFKEQFNISPVWGTLVMALASMLTVITGTYGVVNAISAIVPLLIISVLYILISSLCSNPITQAEIETSKTIAGATPNWLLSAFNYASYNLVIAIAVLAPIGAKARGKKQLFWGALIGSLGLGVSIAAIDFCVLTNVSYVSDLEVPMMLIASKISAFMKVLFAIVIFGEVYSTAVGNLFGFAQRVSLNMSKPLLIALATAGAFVASQLGFSNLVRFLYPAVGYGALIFFAGTIRAWIRTPKIFDIRGNR